MKAMILLTTTKSVEMDNTIGYVIGAVIAVLLLGYLIYSLINPEKF